jgi:anion-transporting  ArsA/GET3 family ATPase
VKHAASRSAGLAGALADLRILVVCGSGGVGKTTTSAALAIAGALAGRRVLVCTIDPSRRLATSLGLAQLKEKPKQLQLQRVAPEATGTVSAVMLDTKRTFDALVERYAPTEDARRRILDNTFYRHVSDALAGSHEYMAMEKLLELSDDARFDLVVLDTPPTRHALDFLEAPERMLSFLDTSILRWFLKPYFVAGRLTLKVATRTGAAALKLADRALGLQFLRDLSEFFLAFEGMYDGFKQRAGRVHALLRDASSGFVLVTSPARTAVAEGIYFHTKLKDKNMPFVSFVVNRVHLDVPGSRPSRAQPAATARVRPELAERLRQLYEEQQVLARVERTHIARLEVDTRESLTLVPELESDVHDLRGLLQVARLLAASEASRGARARGASTR